MYVCVCICVSEIIEFIDRYFWALKWFEIQLTTFYFFLDLCVCVSVSIFVCVFVSVCVCSIQCGLEFIYDFFLLFEVMCSR